MTTRSRFVVWTTALCLVAAVPLIVLAQDASPLVSFDPAALVDLLPFSPKTKLLILAMLPVLYLALGVARRFTRPETPVGQAVRFIFDGWKHKSELPAPAAAPAQAPAEPRGFASVALLAALAAATLLAFPARAQEALPAPAGVDPTTSTIDAAGPADAVAQSAPEPRWSFKLGRVTVAPAVSFSPMVLSLKDFSVSVGPNVGAGLDWTWPNGYGLATHVTTRETAVGIRPLGSLYAILAPLQAYKLRPGVSYQVGGGTPSWKDALIFGVSIADNFGFPAAK